MPTRGCENIVLMTAPEVGGASLKSMSVPEASMKFSLAEKNRRVNVELSSDVEKNT